MQRTVVSSDEQHKIVLALQEYVTKTYTFTHAFFSSKPNPIITPQVSLEKLIGQLDSDHREELRVFLDEKLNRWHYFSPRTFAYAAPESTILGVVISGIVASVPVSAALYGATILATEVIEQVRHQYSVRFLASEVKRALENVEQQQSQAEERVTHRTASVSN